MSILTRILGKTRPATAAAPPTEPDAPADSSPRLDPAQRRREEDASLSEAIGTGNWAAVGKWVLEGSSTQVRQRAAQAITDAGQLRELLRATRHGNDKNVHRILAARRDAQLAEERRQQQQQADIEAAAAAVAEHSERPVDTNYAARLRQLETRWQEVAIHASTAIQETTTANLARAHDAIEQQRLAAEAAAARKHADAIAAEDARQQREREAQAAAEAEAEQARAREAGRLAALARREADEAALRRLIGLLHQAQGALERGGTARATRLRATIDEALPRAPALPPWFMPTLQQIDVRLAELRDWKTFTVVPKRAELLVRMQGLIGADMSAEELARQVRRLRDDWRTLHRGAGEDPSPEWQQFEEAATRAYEPCREHFARQAEHRRENQAKREALIVRLAAFSAEHDVEQPNLRAIQQTLVVARREWREYAPVDQAAVKSLQARFHEVVDGLQARLDGQYARNVQSRRDLISRASGLLALEDTRDAIERAKELQREWKSAGPVPRHQDNTLWKEFREQCDAVFQRSARESAAHGLALQAGESRALALCGELERIAGLTGDELLQAAQQVDALRDEFEALELPRTSVRNLRQRFARAAERCSGALHRDRSAAAHQDWLDVLAAAAQVQALALATRDGQPAEEREARLEAARAAVAGLGRAPKAARAALDDQFNRAATGRFESDRSASEAALRLLCVRAELRAGLPTPTEDEELRREYQMKRLVAAMSQGERAEPGDLDALLLEWLALGPAAAADYDSLRRRFERCWVAER